MPGSRWRADERVAPLAVAAAGSPQVAVEVTALEELRGGGLGDRGREPVGDHAGRDQLVAERRGDDEPAEPQPGHQAFGQAAGVDDVVGRDPLEVPTGWRW